MTTRSKLIDNRYITIEESALFELGCDLLAAYYVSTRNVKNILRMVKTPDNPNSPYYEDIRDRLKVILSVDLVQVGTLCKIFYNHKNAKFERTTWNVVQAFIQLYQSDEEFITILPDIKKKREKEILEKQSTTKVWMSFDDHYSSTGDSYSKPHNDVVRIADYNLIVIKSILLAWDFKMELQKEGIDSVYLPYSWSDKVLTDIDSGFLDFAIYNDAKIDEYLQKNANCNVQKMTDFGFSMGGKNFHILGSNDIILDKATNEHLLSDLRGAVFAVPMNSDIQNGIIEVLGSNEELLYKNNIKFIDYSTHSKSDILNISSDIFLSSGQNIRLKAKFNGSFKEVLNFEDTINKKDMMNRAKNTLIANKNLINKIGPDKIYQICKKIKQNFIKAWSNIESFQNLAEQLYLQLGDEWDSKEEAYFVIRSIIYETYRFGEPVI